MMCSCAEQAATSEEQNEHFQWILRQVLPEVRRRHPGYSDERVFETAVHLAAYRLRSHGVMLAGPDGAA